MIKEKDLAEFRPQVQFRNGAAIDLKAVQNAIASFASENQIPVAFENEKVKVGGMLGGIGGKELDCVLLYHPEHKKGYFNFVITVTYQGSYAYVGVFGYGDSKLMKKQDAAAAAKAGAANVGKSALHGILNGDDSMAGIFTGAWGMAKGTAKLGASIVKGLSSLGGNKEKLQEEQNWYTMVSDIFNQIVS